MLSSPFRSFWMGGYECADHLNTHGDRVNLLEITGHIPNIEQDYELLRRFNIKSVREGISWTLTESTPYVYNFDHVAKMMDAGKKFGVQQIWDICHFGYPSDLTPLHPHFERRFVSLCEAFVKFYLSKNLNADEFIVTPINEVSFISWLGGEVAATSPFCRGKGWDVKYALMSACISGIKRMKQICPEILIMSTEPLVNIVAPRYADFDLQNRAAHEHQLQYQANDMLTGRICPELGGREEYLDIVGLNFYYNNQYTCCDYEVIPWLNDRNDPRWRSLEGLIGEAYMRYNRPILLAETSHSGEDKAKWINFITAQCYKVIESGVPLCGICIYPIVDRPDWDYPNFWHNSGLWDALPENGLVRKIDEIYAMALSECEIKLAVLQTGLLSNKN